MLRQIRSYLPEVLRKIPSYLTEVLRQIRSYLPEVLRQITSSIFYMKPVLRNVTSLNSLSEVFIKQCQEQLLKTVLFAEQAHPSSLQETKVHPCPSLGPRSLLLSLPSKLVPIYNDKLFTEQH